jgi:aromatic ring-opening dioxygenase LigB subunit
MLDRYGYKGAMRLHSVHAGASSGDGRAVGHALRQLSERISLLVIADGTARRSLKAPGYLDPRAEPYDASVHRAIENGDLSALATLDPELARDLVASGWAALQVLAAAFGDDRPQTTIHYSGAPFGVGYLVATLTRS